jgi:hypothetical protein
MLIEVAPVLPVLTILQVRPSSDASVVATDSSELNHCGTSSGVVALPSASTNSTDALGSGSVSRTERGIFVISPLDGIINTIAITGSPAKKVFSNQLRNFPI